MTKYQSCLHPTEPPSGTELDIWVKTHRLKTKVWTMVLPSDVSLKSSILQLNRLLAVSPVTQSVANDFTEVSEQLLCLPNDVPERIFDPWRSSHWHIRSFAMSSHGTY